MAHPRPPKRATPDPDDPPQIETDAAMIPAAGEAEPSNSQGGASHGHSGGGSGHSVDDEGMILLPKGTKVEVKGNNRTKQSLVGKAGVVKKAIGLGGWHWLVLETGEEVKLQRNALTVLAVPSSPELDNSEDDAAAGGKASREVNKAGTGGADGHGPRAGGRSTRRSAPVPATVRPPAGDSAAMQHAMQQLIGHPYEKPVPRVKFLKLDTSALRRYQEFFGLASPAELTKEELAEAIQAHFEGSEVNERDVVGNFVQAAKRVRSSF